MAEAQYAPAAGADAEFHGLAAEGMWHPEADARKVCFFSEALRCTGSELSFAEATERILAAAPSGTALLPARRMGSRDGIWMFRASEAVKLAGSGTGAWLASPSGPAGASAD